MVDNTDDSPWFCPACFASELPYHQTSKLSYADTSVSTQISPPSWNRYSSVSCLCMNARSIVNKTSDLLALLDSRSLDLVAITETFLGPDILAVRFSLLSTTSLGKITPDMVVVSSWQFALSSQLFTKLTWNPTVYQSYFGQS